MDPARLRELLTVLRDMGVKRAKVPLWNETEPGVPAGEGIALEVEFGVAPEPEPPAKIIVPDGAVLIDKRTGQPVDLDEGAPDLARDPGDAIAAANFPPKT